eukprot:CAMPEP_0179096030 /NCGR_PEP_ID=MMETSP0796-20121207/44121_1 /TAXON_ID=73915 /ORGANISM="Pyrodinium bahamense, Strain pbaha01" /LENGTH=212 /DNA_ID=CAMNT_0020793731 /DNA_START=396 /DNA_END=1034 /DNA_ORIENTATION=-
MALTQSHSRKAHGRGTSRDFRRSPPQWCCRPTSQQVLQQATEGSRPYHRLLPARAVCAPAIATATAFSKSPLGIAAETSSTSLAASVWAAIASAASGVVATFAASGSSSAASTASAASGAVGSGSCVAASGRRLGHAAEASDWSAAAVGLVAAASGACCPPCALVATGRGEGALTNRARGRGHGAGNHGGGVVTDGGEGATAADQTSTGPTS